MEKEFLGDRRKALEEAFFAKRERKLIEAARERAAEEDRRKGLAAASGIDQEAVLDHFIELDLSAETVAALTLMPLVQVAWADGKIDEEERVAVLSAALQNGIEVDGPAYALLDHWLTTRPSATMVEAWREYASALSSQIAPELAAELRDQSLRMARTVAEAAGGFLGLGNKVSSSEEKVLKEVESAFSS